MKIVTVKNDSIVCKAPPAIQPKSVKRRMLAGKKRASSSALPYNHKASSDWIATWAMRGI
jgi:hypothetical protein